LNHLTLIALLEKDCVSFLDEFPDARYFVDDCLKGIDYIANSIKHLDNDDDAVNHGNREPDSSGSFGDLGRSPSLKFKGKILDQANDALPSIKQTLDKIPDLCYRAFNINNALLKPKVFLEILERIDLGFKTLKEMDSCLEGSCEMLDNLLSQIEKLLKDRKLLEQQIEKLIKTQASDQPVE